MNELEDFRDLSKRLSSIMKENDFTIGISDISNSTGIPQNKIRYWEKCNYINSVNPSKNQNHKYSYNTMIQIELIQSYLDSGYTLNMAAKKSSLYNQYGNLFHRFVNERLESIELINNKPAFYVGKYKDQYKIYFIFNKNNIETRFYSITE